jgi:hypothetical protein
MVINIANKNKDKKKEERVWGNFWLKSTTKFGPFLLSHLFFSPKKNIAPAFFLCKIGTLSQDTQKRAFGRLGEIPTLFFFKRVLTVFPHRYNDF